MELTPAESRLLHSLWVTGGTNQDLADQLGVAKRTIGNHLNTIYLKLGAINRTQAIRRAMELGILKAPEAEDAA